MWQLAGTLVTGIHDNYNAHKDGVQGYVESISTVQTGDISHQSGHVQNVTSAPSSGSTYGNVAVSSHTSNRQGWILSQLYSDPSVLDFTRITQWQVSSTAVPTVVSQ